MVAAVAVARGQSMTWPEVVAVAVAVAARLGRMASCE